MSWPQPWTVLSICLCGILVSVPWCSKVLQRHTVHYIVKNIGLSGSVSFIFAYQDLPRLQFGTFMMPSRCCSLGAPLYLSRPNYIFFTLSAPFLCLPLYWVLHLPCLSSCAQIYLKLIPPFASHPSQMELTFCHQNPHLITILLPWWTNPLPPPLSSNLISRFISIFRKKYNNMN